MGGGASRGAYWLHKGLRSTGVESVFMSQYGPKPPDDENVLIYNDNFLKGVKSFTSEWFDRLLVLSNLKRQRGVLLSPSLYGVDITDLKEYKEADIIHLHWINNGFIPLSFFSKSKKKIVWTMRDMWPFTGGCHVPYECERYLTGCGKCPQLGSDVEKDLTHKVWSKKKEAYGNCDINFVSSSTWTDHIAARHPLMDGSNKAVIFNCIDVNLFEPISKKECREELGYNKDGNIVLCGAVNIDIDRNKGFEDIVNALQMVIEKGNVKNLELVVFGTNTIKEELLGRLKVKYIGHIKDDKLLSKYYSLSDVFVSASRQESFGKTLVEAMACETPIVSYDITGPADIVLHKETGYKAKHYEVKSLADGISYVLENKERQILMGKTARERAQSVFSKEVAAKNYLELYNKVLER